MIGWLGLFSLVWFSSLIFNAIETAFNGIFRASKSRNYLVSKFLAISMIPIGWTVWMGSVVITYIARMIKENPWAAEGGWMTDFLVHGFLFTYVIPYLVMVGFFTFVYKVIPTEKISIGNAVCAGALFPP